MGGKYSAVAAQIVRQPSLAKELKKYKSVHFFGRKRMHTGRSVSHFEQDEERFARVSGAGGVDGVGCGCWPA